MAGDETMECSRTTGAVAYLTGDARYPQVKGQVRFLPRADGVLISAQISGLPKTTTGFFGFHIHEGDRCGGVEFADTKSHYDTMGNGHPEHAGDLPPLLSAGGKAYLCVITDRFRVEQVLGRTVVVHLGADDFTSQPAGNAGAKIACGRIVRG